LRLKSDWPLFLTILFLTSLGLLFVFSASSVVAERRFGYASYFFFMRQAIAAVLSFCALMLLSKWDYRRLNNSQRAFTYLGIVIVALVGVHFADPDTGRWYRLGSVSLQPSEFAKPILIIFLAFFASQRAGWINSRHTLLQAAMAMSVLVAAVMKADLGTGLVLVVTAGAVFYAAGLDRRYFVVASAVTLVAVAVAIVSEPYRLQRFIHYFDEDHSVMDRLDPAGAVKSYAHLAQVPPDTGYQARQATVAIGSGGLLGKGLMQGNQKLGYLPEAHTDFIYAIVGEELGLFGTTAVLAGFVIILWRGLRLYWVALDDFGRYLAVGVTVSIVFQAMLNMSVALDLGPTKGIPLPLISYGGSSLLSSMISLGLLLSVSERAR